MMKSGIDHELPEALQDAQAWVRKFASGQVSEWEAQAFKRWRDAHPDHLAAFQEARRQWEMLKTVSGTVLETQPLVARSHREALRGPCMGRRAFLGAMGGMAAAAGVAAVSPLGLWPAIDQWGADYRTAVGEQREIRLHDHVVVAMNTRTSLRHIGDSSGVNGLELIEGEAAVDVPAAAQAFSVVAGPGRIAAGESSFEVRRLDGHACITCMHGTVRIDHPAGKRVLRAWQQARYDEAGIGPAIDINPDEASAWRRGELVFQKTPLPAVIEEINRYRPGRIMLVGDAVRSRTVTARIKIDEIDTALLQIQYSFDLNARSLPSGFLVLS